MELDRLVDGRFSYRRYGKKSNFPGNFSRILTIDQPFCYIDYFTGYHPYPVILSKFQKELSKYGDYSARKFAAPYHLPTYLFFRYMSVRTLFSPYPFNIFLASDLTSVDLYPFFFQDSDRIVLLEVFENVRLLFEKHRLSGFSPNFDHMYLNYYGRDILSKGMYNLNNGNIYSEQIYIDLFNTYFDPLYRTICDFLTVRAPEYDIPEEYARYD
jgi:hypothetical protein